VNRNEESDVAIQRDFQAREGQYVTSVAERNARSNLEVDRRCRREVHLCFANAGNLTVALENDGKGDDRYRASRKRWLDLV
jgi:hypothetical protein